jgi:hypothetical protein
VKRATGGSTKKLPKLETGCRAERRRVRRVGVDDRADVGAGGEHPGVQRPLGVSGPAALEDLAAIVDEDHVVGPDLAQADPAALDPQAAAGRITRAEVAPQVVRVTVTGEDAAAGRDLLTDPGGG